MCVRISFWFWSRKWFLNTKKHKLFRKKMCYKFVWISIQVCKITDLKYPTQFFTYLKIFQANNSSCFLIGILGDYHCFLSNEGIYRARKIVRWFWDVLRLGNFTLLSVKWTCEKAFLSKREHLLSQKSSELRKEFAAKESTQHQA